jgi:hypothetical protein
MAERKRTLGLKIAGPSELTLIRPDGSEHAVHPLWLRERCRDAASIDPGTQQRLQDPSDFDIDLRIVSVAQSVPGVFRIKFSDRHEAAWGSADV